MVQNLDVFALAPQPFAVGSGLNEERQVLDDRRLPCIAAIGPDMPDLGGGNG